MIRTLFTHEFLRTRGLLVTIFGIDILVAAAAYALSLTGFVLLTEIGFAVMMLAAAALTPLVMFGLGYEHWRSSFTGRGYLTHSLPVKGHTQAAVSMFHAFLWALVALVVSACVWMWAAVAKGVQQGEPASTTIHALLASFRHAAGSVSAGWWMVFTLGALLSLFGTVAQIWFSAAVGSEGRMSGTGWGPVVVFTGVYLALQAAATIGLFAVPLVVHLGGEQHLQVHIANVLQLMRTRQESMLPLGIVLPTVLSPLVLVWRTFKSWDEKVSLA